MIISSTIDLYIARTAIHRLPTGIPLALASDIPSLPTVLCAGRLGCILWTPPILFPPKRPFYVKVHWSPDYHRLAMSLALGSTIVTQHEQDTIRPTPNTQGRCIAVGSGASCWSTTRHPSEGPPCSLDASGCAVPFQRVTCHGVACHSQKRTSSRSPASAAALATSPRIVAVGDVMC